MAALDFPSSPTLNQTYTANGKTWTWDGTTWVSNNAAISDGDKGDITVASSGASWTIDNGVVTTAKLGGDITTAGKALLDDADAAAQRTTLGLGTIATQASSNVSITGGTITGVTDITVADGGTGVSSLTAYGVLCGGTTTTGAVQALASLGTSGQILTSNGASTLPSWQAAPTSMVYPSAGIANSTGTAWGTSYTTSGTGTVVALATSPSFTTPILGTPQSGNLSNCTNVSLTTGVSGVLPAANGGTANGFTAFSGPTTSTKTFTLPNASATILTSDATITVGQGGTGSFGPANNGGIAYGTGSTIETTVAGTSGQFLKSSGAGVPTWSALDLANSTSVTGILGAANGGTANGFTAFSGPTTATKTFTLPNASAKILTDNVDVTVAEGGTGVSSLTAYGVICGGTTTTGAVQALASLGTSGQVLTSNGAGALPSWQAAAGGGAAAGGAIYETTGTISSNYSMPSGKNGLSAGPITISSGVTVTIPSGCRWVIL